MKVLLLEDDAPQAQELLRAFAKRSWQVTVLRDADKGLRLASAERFDLILLSAELPGGNGFDLCNRIKQTPSTGMVPVFVMSSASSHDDYVVEKQRGIKAEGFFKKPIVVADVLARLEHSEAEGAAEIEQIPQLEEIAQLEDVADLDDVSVVAPPRPAAELEEVTMIHQPSQPPRAHRPAVSTGKSIPPVVLKAKPGRSVAEQREIITTQERLIISLTAEKEQAIRQLEEGKQALGQAIEAATEAEVERTMNAARFARELAELKTLRERDSIARPIVPVDKRVEELERTLTQERAARAADAEAHALALVALRNQTDEELAALVGLEEDATKERDVAYGAELAEAASAHAAALDRLASAHARELAERDRVHAAAIASARQSFDDAERSLASEREARTADDEAHAELLAAAKQHANDALAESERLRTELLAERDRAHAAALEAATRAHAKELAKRAAAHDGELAARESAHAKSLEEVEVERTKKELVTTRYDETRRALEAKEAELVQLRAELAEEKSKRAAADARHAESVADLDAARARIREEAEKANAEAIAKLEREHSEEIEERKRAHGDEFADRVRSQLEELAELERAHAEALAAAKKELAAAVAARDLADAKAASASAPQVDAAGRAAASAALDELERKHAEATEALVRAHAEKLAERDKAHARASAAVAKRLDDVERQLVSERKLRTEAVDVHASTLAAEKERTVDELAARDNALALAEQSLAADRSADAERIEALEQTLAAERHARAIEAARADETTARLLAVTDKAIGRGDDALHALQQRATALAAVEQELAAAHAANDELVRELEEAKRGTK